MFHARALLLLLAASACAEHPDPTTRAIAAAAHAGGICTGDAVTFTADRAVTQYDCADRALRGIAARVYDIPE